MDDDQERKAAVRERVWARLEAAGASPPGVHGRIPDFIGSDRAADLLTTLLAWQRARTMKANPDRAQQPVRAHALRDGKLLFMAVPNLAEIKPFYRLDPAALGDSPERAADRHVAAPLAHGVAVEELPPIDLVVCGSVAANYDGVRIGKGAGYSDIEVALLAEASLLRAETTIVTTVHELQVLDDVLPRKPHDFTVDYVVTPERVISCRTKHRPAGLDLAQLTPELIEAIPALRTMAQREER